MDNLDKNIITIMRAHRGKEQAITLNLLSDLLNIAPSIIQSRMDFLNSVGYAIQSSNRGYFLSHAGNEWLDKMID